MSGKMIYLIMMKMKKLLTHLIMMIMMVKMSLLRMVIMTYRIMKKMKEKILHIDIPLYFSGRWHRGSYITIFQKTSFK